MSQILYGSNGPYWTNNPWMLSRREKTAVKEQGRQKEGATIVHPYPAVSVEEAIMRFFTKIK